MKNQYDISTFVDVLTVQAAGKNLCERFKKRRKEMGLSQREMAMQSGVNYSSLRRFESTGEISFVSLLNLAKVLGCLEDFNAVFATPIIKDLKDYNND